MEFKNASDTIVVCGYNLYKSDTLMGITTTNDDLAAGIVLRNCIVPHENATDTGHATQTVKTFSCFTDTDALVDTNDLTGAHTETIVGA